jgi:hypothetical protein
MTKTPAVAAASSAARRLSGLECKATWEAETEDLELLDIMLGDLLDQQAAEFPDTEARVYHYPEIGLSLCRAV